MTSGRFRFRSVVLPPRRRKSPKVAEVLPVLYLACGGKYHLQRMGIPMTDMLVKRFEPYFRHPDWGHDVLGPGDRAIACENVRTALSWLAVASPGDPSLATLYDEDLKDAVRVFQTQHRNRVADGLVGPSTRQLLVSEVLHQFGPSIFQRLSRPEGRQSPSVFLSYAWEDGPQVNKLDQWLRDHGVSVVRDRESFVPGVTIEENIAQALSIADKIVAVFSQNSRNRDWPHLERSLAEQVEARLGSSVLIYLCLDDTPLPAHDSARLAVTTEGHSLKEVGERLLRAITGADVVRPHYHYDENEPL